VHPRLAAEGGSIAAPPTSLALMPALFTMITDGSFGLRSESSI